MKDIGTTPQAESPTTTLVRRLVARLQWDPDLAYLISPFTETYEHLLRAVQEVLGVDAQRAESLLRCRDRHRPRVVSLAERVEELEQVLDDRCPGWREHL